MSKYYVHNFPSLPPEAIHDSSNYVDSSTREHATLHLLLENNGRQVTEVLAKEHFGTNGHNSVSLKIVMEKARIGPKLGQRWFWWHWTGTCNDWLGEADLTLNLKMQLICWLFFSIFCFYYFSSIWINATKWIFRKPIALDCLTFSLPAKNYLLSSERVTSSLQECRPLCPSQRAASA